MGVVGCVGQTRPKAGALVFCDVVGVGGRAPRAGVTNQVTQIAKSDEKMLAMNEALLLGSLRQHEFAEASDNLNAQLRAEIVERSSAKCLTTRRDRSRQSPTPTIRCVRRQMI